MATQPDVHARFEDLVRRYGRLISSVVGRVGGRAAVSIREDVEQRVLLSLWKQVEREQTIDYPSSYIYRAAVRETVRVLREEDAPAGEPSDDHPDAALGADDPHQVLEARERAAQIEAGLCGLQAERACAVRAHLAGFEVAEIMTMYGWPYQKARNLVARGMADLRSALRARGLHA
jgi:DNA-directed RNA polymerase specialized sigma24 family protein